jgi:predicted metal-dependent phosphoesterase TrpH
VGIRAPTRARCSSSATRSLISRTHFARFLVETGVCRDTSEVFRKYLTEGKPGYVPHRWAKLGDAVRWITRSRRRGGHRPPGALQASRQRGVRAVLRVQAHGGQGVEVVTGSHTAPNT